MRLYDVAMGIADVYKRKVRTELDKEHNISDYKVFVIGKNSYVFLHGLFLMSAPSDESFVIGDGITETDELPKMQIKKTGWITGQFVERKE